MYVAVYALKFWNACSLIHSANIFTHSFTSCNEVSNVISCPVVGHSEVASFGILLHSCRMAYGGVGVVYTVGL